MVIHATSLCLIDGCISGNCGLQTSLWSSTSNLPSVLIFIHSLKLHTFSAQFQKLWKGEQKVFPYPISSGTQGVADHFRSHFICQNLAISPNPATRKASMLLVENMRTAELRNWLFCRKGQWLVEYRFLKWKAVDLFYLFSPNLHCRPWTWDPAAEDLMVSLTSLMVPCVYSNISSWSFRKSHYGLLFNFASAKKKVVGTGLCQRNYQRQFKCLCYASSSLIHS